MTTTDTGPQTEAGRRFVESTGVWAVAEVLAIEAEARRLTVERLTPFLSHNEECWRFSNLLASCSCGLDAALAQEETRA